MRGCNINSNNLWPALLALAAMSSCNETRNNNCRDNRCSCSSRCSCERSRQNNSCESVFFGSKRNHNC